VLCNDCFQGSNHEGHEVFFYHSQAGGCCDCGDSGSWNSNGFCGKHGKSLANPLETIPPDVVRVGNIFFPILSQYIVDYCRSWIDRTKFEPRDPSSYPPGKYIVTLQNDDVHSVDEVINALHAANVEGDLNAIATKVHKTGRCMLTPVPVSYHDAIRMGMILKEKRLSVAIVDEREDMRNRIFLSIIAWLYKMAQAGDGMCRLLCNAFTIEQIADVMRADAYITKEIIVPLHGLFLTMMADFTFKMLFSRSYAMAFHDAACTYSDGIGTSENSLFSISVQFLNRDTYVEGIILNYSFLETVSNSLLSMLTFDKDKILETSIILYRRYTQIVGDLKIVFTIKDVSRLFCATCFDTWLQILYNLQYIHEQKQSLLYHVQYESREWIYAFNLYLSIASLFEYIVNWFEYDTSIHTMEELLQLAESDRDNSNSDYNTITIKSRRSIPLPINVLKQTLSWHSRWIMNFDFKECGFPTLDVPYSSSDIESQSLILYYQPINRSFHLFIHRFLANTVRECTKYPHLNQTLEEFYTYLTNDRQNLTALIDFPLCNIIWMSEIKSEMWRKNGQVSYNKFVVSKYHLCIYFKLIIFTNDSCSPC
jgi:hypothetical protein